MKATICDFCKEPIIDQSEAKDGEIYGAKFDICGTCFTSPVILSEMRRTRTRKPPVKRGRPRGSKKTETVEVGDGHSE